ncbi:uncharacterized protein LOC135958365 [Calliphora vicina]|uniref:uncharacterized protein LOC135958365 n=1 Tax=Calliphora vicina TaxID=7373 RepID=UPI00325BCE24
MSNEHPQHSKGKLKYFPQEVTSTCSSCEESEKRYNTLLEILAEHKVLLDTIVKQNQITSNLMEFFPIESEEKLREFDAILKTHSDPYIRQMKSLLAGNAEKNLHEIFGQNIIMNFNVDGSFGKKRLREYANVFKAIIDVISTFNENSDKTIRAAFQRQKKKYFKQMGRSKTKNNENREDDDSPKED